MSDQKKRRLNAGLILIVIGLGLFAMDRMEGIGAEVVLLIIGAAFLVAYFLQKNYGLLIPACIMLGLGVGRVGGGSMFELADGNQFGLAIGFISIYVIARLYEGKTHWWPLIPGAVLLLVSLPYTHRYMEFIFDHWQLILVLIGVLMIAGALRGSQE